MMHGVSLGWGAHSGICRVIGRACCQCVAVQANHWGILAHAQSGFWGRPVHLSEIRLRDAVDADQTTRVPSLLAVGVLSCLLVSWFWAQHTLVPSRTFVLLFR